MLRQHRSASAGLTIIEVLFVMAIAGVVMLLVFLAVPTLTRNANNSDRKRDVTTVLQEISRYQLSNSGNFPQACSGDQDAPPPPNPQSCKSLFLKYAHKRLSFYNPDKISVSARTAATVPVPSAPADSESFVVHNYLRCVDGAPTKLAAGYFDTAALFRLETRTGFEAACQEL